jgi:outer membrane protein TolC
MQLKQLTTLVSALALAACSVGPDYAPPKSASTAAGPFISANSPAVQPLAPVQGDWWRLYNDPVLDGLITDALAHNTDVRAAVARLARARAALKEVKVDRLPEVGASASATRGRDPGESDAGNSFDAGLDVAYEVDLFGRISRNVEAARGDIGAAEADAEAVRVAIVAETARAYADAASAAERLAVATHIVELLDQSLKLTERRVEIGLNSRLDTARIATLRNQRQAEIPAIAAERDNALFRLAMLTGRAPAAWGSSAGARPVNIASRNNALSRSAAMAGISACLWLRSAAIRAVSNRVVRPTSTLFSVNCSDWSSSSTMCEFTSSRSAALAASA